MQSSDKPTPVPVPFASGTGGAFNVIPVSTATFGAASLDAGFPAETRVAIASGGIPPDGLDMNGILNLVTQSVRWFNVGGLPVYDGTFAAAVGGYPKGCVIEASDFSSLWLCTTNNNTNDPDAGGAGWAPLIGYGLSVISGLTNANVTLTTAQYNRLIVMASGTLTGNVQLIFPNTIQSWIIVNNTTGNYTLTAKTVAGTGPELSQGVATQVYGDGTNINLVGTAAFYKQFTSSGTFTKEASYKFVMVEGSGAGGGGSGGGGSSSGGRGGGAGGYFLRMFSASDLASTVTCTIGAAGAAGTKGTQTVTNSTNVIVPPTDGGDGGTTSFGSYLVIPGGSKGTSSGAGSSQYNPFTNTSPIGGDGAAPNAFPSNGSPGIGASYVGAGTAGGTSAAGDISGTVTGGNGGDATDISGGGGGGSAYNDNNSGDATAGRGGNGGIGCGGGGGGSARVKNPPTTGITNVATGGDGGVGGPGRMRIYAW